MRVWDDGMPAKAATATCPCRKPQPPQRAPSRHMLLAASSALRYDPPGPHFDRPVR
jgi:hypothetical protein